MLEFLVKHANSEKASFHMPGHKGAAFFERLGYGDRLSGIVDHDITEIPGADDLRHADGIIKTITDSYQNLYGSKKSFISVNGSSALIMAAIMTCVKPGHKLLAAADCHISVRNGATLAGAETMYLDTQTMRPWHGKNAGNTVLSAPGSLSGLNGDGAAAADFSRSARSDTQNAVDEESFSIPAGVSAKDVAKALDTDPLLDAVILPSPNYFGVVSDIKSIADEVHARGKVLIVDQAHGAHLKMFAGCNGSLPLPAEDCGADIVIVSTHKTMASFTQTAVSNIMSDVVDAEVYEKNLLMLESTSPSYILMESLAVNADIMAKHGSDLAASWRGDLDWFYDEARRVSGVRVLTRDLVKRAAGSIDFDDTKIVIDFSRLGMDGEQAERLLMKKGIYPELNTGSIVMCLTGIGNVRKDYELLLDALIEISGAR